MRDVDGVPDVHLLHGWSLSSSRAALSAEIKPDEIGAWDAILPQLQTLLVNALAWITAPCNPKHNTPRITPGPCLLAGRFDWC